MSIEEDQNEFNTTGVRGLLRKAITVSDEVFIKITEGGHQGEVVATRPSRGSGSYLHDKRGEGAFEYRNFNEQDTHRELFRIEV